MGMDSPLISPKFTVYRESWTCSSVVMFSAGRARIYRRTPAA